MLEVRDLAVAYRSRPVLSGVNLRVDKNEIVALIGRNAAGKSTLLKAIMGTLPVLSGTITFAADDITRLAPHRRAHLGLRYVPQDRTVFANLSVRENLMIGAELEREGRLGEVQAVLETFPRLGSLMSRQAGTLSGGERQTLALARAMVGRPGILLLDEPTAGVQPSAVDEIVAHLKRASRDTGVPIVLVEHNVEMVAALSTRVCVLAHGRIAAEIAPGELRDEAILRKHLTV